MKRKTAPVTVKAADASTEDGVFEAIVSVFGNVDSWGDVVEPGAFTKTLADWKAKGDSIPVLWSHRADDPRFNIGTVLDAEELAAGDKRIPEWADPVAKKNGGLYVKARIDTGPDASDVAVAARRLLKDRRVTQFSFAYDVIESGQTKVEGQNANALRELKLYEISPTQIGANDRTELIGAKAAGDGIDPDVAALLGVVDESIDAAVAAIGAADEAIDAALAALGIPDDDEDETDAAKSRKARRLLLKVGRTLSAKNEGNIRKAVELLQQTLTALDSSDDDGKSKSARGTADVRALVELAEAEALAA